MIKTDKSSLFFMIKALVLKSGYSGRKKIQRENQLRTGTRTVHTLEYTTPII